MTPLSDRRTEEQMKMVFGRLWAAWRGQPTMRLCQLIVNATDRTDPFYVEDDDLMAHLDAYPRVR